MAISTSLLNFGWNTSTLSVTVPSGTQALVFFFGNEDSAGTAPTIDTLMDDTSPTPQTAVRPTGALAQSGGGPSNTVEALVCVSPAIGTTTWTASLSGGTPDRNRFLGCIGVSGVDVGALVDAVGASDSGSSPISTEITTTEAGALILGIVMHDAISGDFAPQDGQSTILNETSPGSSTNTGRVLLSSYVAASATTYDLGWTNSGTVTRLVQVLVALTPGEPPEPNPKLDTLSFDSFPGSELPEELVVDELWPGVTVSGGAVVLAGDALTPGTVRTASQYDITDSQVVIHWDTTAANGEIGIFRIRIVSSGNHGYLLTAQPGSGTLAVSRSTGIGGTALFSDVVAEADYQWVRFRESSGTFYIEISANGTTWDELASESTDSNTSFAPASVVLGIASEPGLTGEEPSTLRVLAINPSEGDEPTEAAAPALSLSAAVVPAAATVGAVAPQARATRLSARVLAATVTLGAITAPAATVSASVRTVAANAAPTAIAAPAPAIRTTALVLAADMTTGAVVPGAPALAVSTRVLPATVTLGAIAAPSRPVTAVVGVTTAAAHQVTSVAAAAPVALSARVTGADSSLGAVPSPAAPARLVARVVAAGVSIGAITAQAAPVAVVVRVAGATGQQIVGAATAAPVAIAARVLAADVTLAAVDVATAPVRITTAPVSTALSLGIVAAPAGTVRLGLNVASATAPESVAISAAPGRLSLRVLAATVTLTDTTVIPHVRNRSGPIIDVTVIHAPIVTVRDRSGPPISTRLL